MEITSALGAAAGTPSVADKSAQSLADDFTNFLTLLTTQLKFQDPLEPMDSNEFTAQLVRFTQVEQSINTNKNLENLLSMQNANQTTGALGYIGKTVEASSKTLALSNGSAEISYTLPSQAAAAAVIVLDSAGNAVFSAPVETAPGKHGFVWDGKDSNGAQLPDGTYSFVIGASDADQNTISATTAAVAKVTGIETTKDGVLLSLGALQVPVPSVISVRETQPASGI